MTKRESRKQRSNWPAIQRSQKNIRRNESYEYPTLLDFKNCLSE
ncbi:hypothetical protein [Porphyromonas pogonae]|nr:hypothetical protein [Porphyromonas pogonae]